MNKDEILEDILLNPHLYTSSSRYDRGYKIVRCYLHDKMPAKQIASIFNISAGRVSQEINMMINHHKNYLFDQSREKTYRETLVEASKKYKRN